MYVPRPSIKKKKKSRRLSIRNDPLKLKKLDDFKKPNVLLLLSYLNSFRFKVLTHPSLPVLFSSCWVLTLTSSHTQTQKKGKELFFHRFYLLEVGFIVSFIDNFSTHRRYVCVRVGKLIHCSLRPSLPHKSDHNHSWFLFVKKKRKQPKASSLIAAHPTAFFFFSKVEDVASCQSSRRLQVLHHLPVCVHAHHHHHRRHNSNALFFPSWYTWKGLFTSTHDTVRADERFLIV